MGISGISGKLELLSKFFEEIIHILPHLSL